jgi:hypothetical protein
MVYKLYIDKNRPQRGALMVQTSKNEQIFLSARHFIKKYDLKGALDDVIEKKSSYTTQKRTPKEIEIEKLSDLIRTLKHSCALQYFILCLRK